MKHVASIILMLIVITGLLTACGGETTAPASETGGNPPVSESASPSGDERTSSGSGGGQMVFYNSWRLEDFVIAGFSKDGPGDFGYQARLTAEEQQQLSRLLQTDSWQEAEPVEHGLSSVLDLRDQEGRRYLSVYDGAQLGALISLRDEETGESWLFSAPDQVLEEARALGGSLEARAKGEQEGGTGSGDTGETEVLFLQLLSHEVQASPLYAQALTRPSVILFDDQPVTSRAVVDRFLQRVEEGSDGELYLYSFITIGEERSCLLIRLTSKGGKVTESLASERSWDQELAFDNSYAVTKIQLTEYGYLTYEGESGSEPMGYQVVNDRELFSDASQRQEMEEKYLDPIFPTALSGHWDDPTEMSLLWVFEDLYRCENGGSPFDQYGTDWPVGEMVELLGRYFDGITRELILSEEMASAYDSQTDTIHYEGGRGGGPFCLRVTSWETEEELLTLHYEHYDCATGIPYENGQSLLTIRLMEDGSFRYLSNQEDPSA